jgi:hypothetical protein
MNEMNMKDFDPDFEKGVNMLAMIIGGLFLFALTFFVSALVIIYKAYF